MNSVLFSTRRSIRYYRFKSTGVPKKGAVFVACIRHAYTYVSPLKRVTTTQPDWLISFLFVPFCRRVADRVSSRILNGDAWLGERAAGRKEREKNVSHCSNVSPLPSTRSHQSARCTVYRKVDVFTRLRTLTFRNRYIYTHTHNNDIRVPGPQRYKCT